MSAPLRFLSISVLAWAALRATTLGALPGFTVSHARSVPPPPIVPTELESPLPASAPEEYSEWATPPEAASIRPARTPVRTRAVPYYLPAYPPVQTRYYAAPIAPRRTWSLASNSLSLAPAFVPAAAPASADYAQLPPLVPMAGVPQRSTPLLSGAAVPVKPRLDRWQMSSWAVLRGLPAPGALVSGETLGGSQAGARVTYAVNRSLAASLRMTSPIGGSRGAEIAAGIRWQPLRSIPVAITAERRQSISPHGGGRNDFALFAEGGLYRQPMPWRFELDAYAQAGVVGLTERDIFADGAVAFTRPVFGRFSAGFGVWGGYQPGLYRLDAGPRVSIRIRDNIRAHVDWRQRVVGNAQPTSGPALTLAADF
ncbi:MAG: hypothetical protein H0T82_08590 [Sphingomonas sp.]|nr:hypothetical protein [Sphingomonas sp.]